MLPDRREGRVVFGRMFPCTTIEAVVKAETDDSQPDIVDVPGSARTGDIVVSPREYSAAPNGAVEDRGTELLSSFRCRGQGDGATVLVPLHPGISFRQFSRSTGISKVTIERLTF